MVNLIQILIIPLALFTIITRNPVNAVISLIEIQVDFYCNVGHIPQIRCIFKHHSFRLWIVNKFDVNNVSVLISWENNGFASTSQTTNIPLPQFLVIQSSPVPFP